MKLVSLIACGTVMFVSVSEAREASRCMAVATAPANAIESPSSYIKRGETWGPITQVRVNKQDGSISYCAHGDYCYNSTNVQFAAACEINSKPDSPDYGGDEWIYGVR